jgi:putative ABC transport system substrate-binding protein
MRRIDRNAARVFAMACCVGLAWTVGCGGGGRSAGPPAPPPVPDRPHRIAVIEPAEGRTSGLSAVPARGISEGLELFQFEEGRHVSIEPITLDGEGPEAVAGAIGRASEAGADLIVLTHGSMLGPAVERATAGPPIVFGMLGDPKALGAGDADDGHRPGLTGAYHPLPSGRLLTLVSYYLPEADRVGVVFDPDDPISVAHKEAIVEASADSDLEVVAADSFEELEGEEIDALCLAAHAPEGVLGRAEEAGLPVFGIDEGQVRAGAVAAEIPLADRVGTEVGRVVFKVLDGGEVDEIPFSRVIDVEAVVNPWALERLSIPMPTGALRISRPIGGSGERSD